MDNLSRKAESQAIEIDAAAFSERLREMAAQRGLTQSELARRTGTKRQSMADYWVGRRIAGSDRLFPIADELAVSARWLLYGTSEQFPEPSFRDEQDWVWVPRYDFNTIGGEKTKTQDAMIHVDRNWLTRTYGKTEGIWFAEMPSDALSDVVQRGETLVLEDVSADLVEGRHYAFLLDGRVLVRRYDVVPGKIVLSGSNPGVIPITVELGELGRSLRPIAHIIGAFSLRSF